MDNRVILFSREHTGEYCQSKIEYRTSDVTVKPTLLRTFALSLEDIDAPSLDEFGQTWPSKSIY